MCRFETTVRLNGKVSLEGEAVLCEGNRLGWVGKWRKKELLAFFLLEGTKKLALNKKKIEVI